MASSERFGFEWNRYSEMEEHYELQFRRWVAPLQEADFQGKKVLDAGCGMGRNSVWPLKWGARELTAFDLDKRSVTAARRNLSRFSNARVEQRNIYELEWENEFDLAFSIGVVHHLENPRWAIANMIRAVKPGGTILLWVYSFEGNDWIVRWVNPIRKIVTSRLPLPMVHALSYACSIPLWFWVKLFPCPTPYLRQLSAFPFRHVHSIVFDQLIPRIANYWTHDEARALLEIPGVEDVRVYEPENEMGWTVMGRKRV